MYGALTVAGALVAPLGILSFLVPRQERMDREIVTRLQTLLQEGLAAAEACARANDVAKATAQHYRSAN